MKFVWQNIVAILFVILLVLIQITYWINPITLSDFIKIKDQLLFFSNHYPLFASVVYMSMYVLSIIFGIPISITIIGGYFFGIIHGIAYSMLGVLIGVTILGSFVRYVMHDWVQERYGDELDPFNKEIEKYGLYYVLMIHSIPFMPSFLPNIAMSLSSMSLYNVIGVNVIGAVPLTVIYVIAGAYLHNLNSLNDFILYVSIFGGIIALPLIGATIYRFNRK